MADTLGLIHAAQGSRDAPLEIAVRRRPRGWINQSGRYFGNLLLGRTSEITLGDSERRHFERVVEHFGEAIHSGRHFKEAHWGQALDVCRLGHAQGILKDDLRYLKPCL